MLGGFSKVEKIYMRTGYTDMGKQLDGLADIIRYNFQLNPSRNPLLLFCGKRADWIKVVYYKGGGTAPAFPISVTKTAASNSCAQMKKLGRSLPSSSAGC